jgi:putative FmdB family regulatory protein
MIYVYKCRRCGTVAERIHRMSETPRVRCPNCKRKMRRVIQGAGVILRGSGWYSTDNRSEEKSD